MRGALALLLLAAGCAGKTGSSGDGVGAASGASGATTAAGAGTSGGGAAAGASGALATSGSDSGGSGSGGSAGASGASTGDGGEQAMAGAAGSSSSCSAEAVARVSNYAGGWDPLGYPLYALDGCVLLYVASEQGGGVGLHRLDLETGDDRMLDASHPRRPTLAGNVMAWERDFEGYSGVRIVSSDPPRDEYQIYAGEPRASEDAVVFTRFLGTSASSDTDIALYDVKTGQFSDIATGPGQQRFADVSSTHVVFTDFSEDSKGYYDEMSSVSDVVVVTRATGERTTRSSPGKQAFPLLGDDGLLVYLEWGAVHPEPKFGEFFLKAGAVSAPVSSDVNVKGQGTVQTNPAYVRPSLRGRYLDFVDQALQTPRLFRSVLGSATPAPPALVDIGNSSALYGPVSTDAFTLLARSVGAAPPSLIAVAR